MPEALQKGPTTIPQVQEPKSITVVGSPDQAKPPFGSGSLKGTGPQSDVDCVIEGLLRDIERLGKETGPNKQHQIDAVCRVLNDCNKHVGTLQQLFAGAAGKDWMRDALREGIWDALKLANGHLKSKTAEILKEWPICQLFNGIRGILSCQPFQGTSKQYEQAARKELADLADNLWVALDDLSVLAPESGPAAKGRWKLLPYAPILLSLMRIHENRLVDFSRHRKVLQQLLGAIAASGEKEGWDVQGFANAAVALGKLLDGDPPALTPEEAAPAARTLVELIDESIHDSYGQPEWKPIGCQQAQKGLKRMLMAAKAGLMWEGADTLLANVLDDLEKLRNGIPIQPAGVIEKPEVVPVEATALAQTKTASQPDRPAEPEEAAQPEADEPAEQDTKIVHAPKPYKTDALKRRLAAAAKTSPKALASEINRLNKAPSKLRWAGAEDLCGWLTLLSTTRRPTEAGAKAVLALAKAVQLAPALKAGERAALLLALGKALETYALETYPAWTGKLKAAMRSLCEQLLLSCEDMQLRQICSAVQGFAPLIVDGDKSALLALERMAKASASSSGATLQPENFDFSRMSELLRALAPVLGKPAVVALLEQLTTRFKDEKALVNWSGPAARATALAEIVSNALKNTNATDALVSLMNELAQGLGVPAELLTRESINTTRGRQDLVFSLLKPHWITMDKGVISVEPPSEADSDLVTQFVGGLLETKHRARNIPSTPDKASEGARTAGGLLEMALSTRTPINIEPNEQLNKPMALGHFEWAKDRARNIPGEPDEAAEVLVGIIVNINAGYEWMARTGSPGWQATMADATLHIADALMLMGDDAVKQLRAKLPVDIQLLFRDELKAAERFTKEDLPDASSKRTAQREKAAALLRTMEPVTAFPRWTDAATGNETPAAGEIPSMGEALARLDQLIEAKDFTALKKLAEAIPTLKLGSFDFQEFSKIVPKLRLILGHETGRATVRALAQRMGKLADGSNAPLTPNQAMQLVADIACNAVSSTDKDANAAVFLLMDVIARKCNRKPVDWEVNWWTNWQLETTRGLGEFVLRALGNAWKTVSGYHIPPDASPQLVTAFSIGKESSDHETPLHVQGWIHAVAMVRGLFDLLGEQHMQCKNPADFKNLLAPAMHLVLVCTGLIQKNIQLPPQVLRQGYMALLHAIVAWNNPEGLIKSLPEKRRDVFRTAVGYLGDELSSPQGALLGARITDVKAFNALQLTLAAQHKK